MKKIILLLLTAYLSFSCQKEDFTTSGMADDQFFLQSEGQNMPVWVYGNLNSGKMIILLHGGPGGDALFYRSEYVVENFESEYAMVYWDQRFAGSSQGNGGSKDISQFPADLKKLLMLLRVKYGADMDFYLMGHSWGGFIAPYFLLEKENQELVKGWIQVDGAHTIRWNSFVRDAFLSYGKVEIAADRNVDYWNGIIDYCNSSEYKDVSYDVLLEMNKMGHAAQNSKLDHLKATSPEYVLAPNKNSSIARGISYVNNLYFTGILEDAYNSDPVVANLEKIEVPVLILWGKHDLVCPIAMADDLEQRLGSKDIRRVVFDGSFHAPMMQEPVAFWNSVREWLKEH